MCRADETGVTGEAHVASGVEMLKSLARVLLIVAGLGMIHGCSSGAMDQGSPIAENGQPLGFQLTNAAVPKGPQYIRHVEIVLGEDFLKAATSGGTYSGPTQTNVTYPAISPKGLQSFVAVEFTLSNVARKLALTTKDVEFIDGAGSAHQSFALADPEKASAWVGFSGVTISPQRSGPDVERWIFTVPNSAMKGSSIRFQGTLYPLTIGR
jgi:hypothetical protein